MTGGKSLLPALACAAAFVLGGLAGSAEEASRAQALKTVELKDMTWVEVRAALKEGYKTVLVPTGGIEQNGPHMVLGKHDYIVAWAAREVALGAGKTLVAPVVSYVPEGGYGPPTGHMRFPGTIGIPDAAFAGLLEGIARSLKTHGFTLICFMGDHGDSQRVQRETASRLSEEWKRSGVRVANLDAYYDDSAQVKRLEAEGMTTSSIGQHAAVIDTSELMAIHPAGVDLDKTRMPRLWSETPGSSGEPHRSSAELGRELIKLRIEAAIAQIETLRRE